MTVLVFLLTFYWAPVLSQGRELASLLSLVWSDKLVPLPWDWTMDKNKFLFEKIQQFAFSYTYFLYWFHELSEILSVLLQSRFIWKRTVVMATIPEKSVFCLLLTLPRAKPRPFIPSAVVCRETLEFIALCHYSSKLLSLQLSSLSEPAKEKGKWGKNQKKTSFFLMVSDPLTVNCFEIAHMSVASCPDTAHISALSHNTFFIYIKNWTTS